jgi:hypothetical protein
MQRGRAMEAFHKRNIILQDVTLFTSLDMRHSSLAIALMEELAVRSMHCVHPLQIKPFSDRYEFVYS